ncbi:Multidrug resistance protein homolog 49 [Eumeta japonica]|uniref:Multidrug resistance protein homolog 49 n=1 Tax=Eumeta variegata TaxID=151549 RepID=A0A4C2A986_EUMVA|nr:Multidrug resistance protein homolog 49 [Eumeta japonica]
MFLQAVLRQDMSYFDTDTSMNLASRMSDDLVKLKEGMGDKLAIVGNLVGTAVINICIAFPLGWELTLACLTVVPFSIAASVLLSNIKSFYYTLTQRLQYQAKSSARELDSYSMAGKQAEEVLKSIRTVVAFGGEDTEVKRYKHLLEPAERYGRHRSIYTGIGTGFSWVLTYSLNTIGLAYGTRLVVNDLYLPVDQRRYVVGDILSLSPARFAWRKIHACRHEKY